MPIVSYMLIFGEIILGTVEMPDACHWQFIPRMPESASRASQILAKNRYVTSREVFLGASYLLPDGCRQHLRILRLENGNKVREENYKPQE